MANLKTKKYFFTPKEALGGRIGDDTKHQFGNYGTDNPRPNLMKAAHIPTDRMFKKLDGRAPDYYGLEPVVDEDSATIMPETDMALPSSIRRNLFISFATMSRPPEDASRRNKIANPAPTTKI